ncbi:hypothetical protein [Methylomonas sp. TEB]|uniref:hypothetical protein n=1 Tax=Methylomonas sp. TEB TaxID=3398229 RepID=UPI0039F59D7F
MVARSGGLNNGIWPGKFPGSRPDPRRLSAVGIFYSSFFASKQIGSVDFFDFTLLAAQILQIGVLSGCCIGKADG